MRVGRDCIRMKPRPHTIEDALACPSARSSYDRSPVLTCMKPGHPSIEDATACASAAGARWKDGTPAVGTVGRRPGDVRSVLPDGGRVDRRVHAADRAHFAGVSEPDADAVRADRARPVVTGGGNGRACAGIVEGDRDCARGLAVPRASLAVAIVGAARVGIRCVATIGACRGAGASGGGQVGGARRLPGPAQALTVRGAAHDATGADLRCRACAAERAGGAARAARAAPHVHEHQSQCADEAKRESETSHALPLSISRA
jgi:hypothetical protein